MKEQHLYKALQARHSKNGVLFRNNTGTAYQGKKAVYNGRTVLTEIRPITFGFCIGSSDLIGWTEKIITKDMIGQKIAIFTALEVKNLSGKATKEQINFIKQVRKSGGIGEIMRWIDEDFKADEI
jgi:hypothetical protein